jgi:hypothetical protein
LLQPLIQWWNLEHCRIVRCLEDWLKRRVEVIKLSGGVVAVEHVLLNNMSTKRILGIYPSYIHLA